MRERPILFSAPMVRAILAGTKTQTRRVVTTKHALPPEGGYSLVVDDESRYGGLVREDKFSRTSFPLGRLPFIAGDRLWVRETHAQFAVGEPSGLVPQCVAYRASCDGDSFDYVRADGAIDSLSVTKWTPSIYMPRWASRITLEVTEVRVGRLQNISTMDAMAEGVHRPVATGAPSYTHGFRALWDSINGKREGCSWDANPWVWAVSFKRVQQEQAP